MLIRELLSQFEAEYNKPPVYSRDGFKIAGRKGYKVVEGYLHMIQPFLGKLEVTGEDLAKLRVALYGAGYATGTVNNMLQLIRRAASIWTAKGLISVNPFQQTCIFGQIIDRTHDNKRERVLTSDEEERLLEGAKSSRCRKLYAGILMALDTGMRRGEIESLLWTDVDLDGNTINIRAQETKTERGRVVPISKRLRGELELMRKEGLVIGKIDESFRLLRDRLGIDDLHFHDLRHTFATRLSQKGFPLAQLARLLGHASLSTVTYRYTTITAEAIDAARTLLDEMGSED